MLLKKLNLNIYFDLALLVFLVVFPLFAGEFRTELMGKFIVYILLAFSVDLLWGYAGLMNLGQAVLFGMGGYVIALSGVLSRGVPDFMSRFGINEIPAFLQPLGNPVVAFGVGIILPCLFAAFLGYFLFTSKIGGIFFSIITLALSELAGLFISSLQKYTGGDNGINTTRTMLLTGQPIDLLQLYYIVLLVAVVIYLACRWLMSSRFGVVVQSIRENETRLKYLGYNPNTYKLILFVISGFISGLAGMFYIPMNMFISPDDVSVMFSTSVLIWVALGGKGNLTGAALGCMFINWMQNLLSESFSDYWQLILGCLLVVIVLFIPDGFMGKLLKMQYQHRTSRSPEQATIASSLENTWEKVSN